MKNFVFLIIIISMLFSCVKKTHEEQVKTSVKNYIENKLDDQKSLEDVSFSTLKKDRYLNSLDTVIDVGVDIKNAFDYKGYTAYVNRLKEINPENANEYLRLLDEITSGKLDYYSIRYRFRANIRNRLQLREYEFRLDSNGKILESYDMTDELGLIK